MPRKSALKKKEEQLRKKRVEILKRSREAKKEKKCLIGSRLSLGKAIHHQKMINLYGHYKETRISRSKRAGVTFPVGSIHRQLKKRFRSNIVGHDTPVFMTAVLQDLAENILILAGNFALHYKKKRIIPKFLDLAITTNSDIAHLCRHPIIPHTGSGASSKVMSQMIETSFDVTVNETNT